LGRKTKSIQKFPACGLNWDVFFNEGNNLLSATGFSNGEKVAVDSVLVNFSTKQNGIPDKIELSVKNLSNGNKLIEATVVDKNGIRCLDYNKRIYFSMNGNGKLLINYGTPTRSQIIEAANGKASIEFKPESNGKAVIEVRNQDFKGSYITIK
jgi:beta-galactosidase